MSLILKSKGRAQALPFPKRTKRNLTPDLTPKVLLNQTSNCCYSAKQYPLNRMINHDNKNNKMAISWPGAVGRQLNLILAVATLHG